MSCAVNYDAAVIYISENLKLMEKPISRIPKSDLGIFRPSDIYLNIRYLLFKDG